MAQFLNKKTLFVVLMFFKYALFADFGVSDSKATFDVFIVFYVFFKNCAFKHLRFLQILPFLIDRARQGRMPKFE